MVPVQRIQLGLWHGSSNPSIKTSIGKLEDRGYLNLPLNTVQRLVTKLRTSSPRRTESRCRLSRNCCAKLFYSIIYRCYQALLRSTPISIIPLPDKDATPGSPAHLSAYQEFPTRATVMALYPDTSCFYRAEVIASPKDIPTQGRVSRSIDRVESVRTVLTRSRYRPLGRRTTNSNLKTTTTRNIWSRRQRS
jgi:hypothetical protein